MTRANRCAQPQQRHRTGTRESVALIEQRASRPTVSLLAQPDSSGAQTPAMGASLQLLSAPRGNLVGGANGWRSHERISLDSWDGRARQDSAGSSAPWSTNPSASASTIATTPSRPGPTSGHCCTRSGRSVTSAGPRKRRSVCRRSLTISGGQELADGALAGRLRLLLECGWAEQRVGNAVNGEREWGLADSGRNAR